MKFFIPEITDAEKAERFYQEMKKCATAMGSIRDRRIRSVTFWDKGKEVRATVGGREPTEGQVVLAIFESGNCFLVCTPGRSLRRLPYMVGKEEVTDSEDFEP